MKIEITRFCQAALRALLPFPPALDAAAEALASSGEKALLAVPLATLHDVRARLRSLTDKLAAQQAYLLIFGPLKSGKSTLMNAISGSYVSEVTSLPGYPCLVFVRHGETAHFSVTRYNGRESVFADGRILNDVVADSHIALAQQIRETEKGGAAFDPRTHFTEAIRRIDVKLPIASLAESSTVLVDTPGLYSRMNFGYDVLTREFRDSAACAVFVVKTDNLFLEQVFTEFSQLLGLFSRVFLVINVDTSKRDLQPDGSLTQSAEGTDPQRIIEAFTTLSMAGPMRAAWEQKRVRIHAIDLMNAAATILQNGSAPAESGSHRAPFDAFLADLTDYLDSGEYMQEFVRDSLRQGHTLSTEARAVADGPEVTQLHEKQGALEKEIAELDERLAAVERLSAVDWPATFKLVQDESARRSGDAARGKLADVTKEMRGSIDAWMGTGESLKALETDRLQPALTRTATALAEDTRDRLGALLGGPLGGAEPAAAVMHDLHSVGFQLAPVAMAAHAALDIPHDAAPYAFTLPHETLPVRKTFADWLLFRRIKTVRRRLFGEDLTAEIAPEEKTKRLTEPTLDALRQHLDEVLATRLPSLPGTHADTLVSAYVEKFTAGMHTGLTALRDRLTSERTARQTPFDANAKIFAALATLLEHTAQTDTALDALTSHSVEVAAT
jgi:GTPase SAR1 family protein